MEEVGISQQEMADLLGITQGAVSNYLNGVREPNIEILANIIRELGVTADWVVLGIRNKGKSSNYNTVGVSSKFGLLTKKEQSKINSAIEILALTNEKKH